MGVLASKPQEAMGHLLEVLGYAAFVVCMVGCLAYVMGALETEDAPPRKIRSSTIAASVPRASRLL